MKYILYRIGLPAFFCIIIVCCQGQSSGAVNNVHTSPKDSIHIMNAGRIVFANTCQACHGNKAFPQAPSLEMLMAVQPRVILITLNSGKMRQQAKALSEKQREAVAQYASHKLIRETFMPKEAYTKFIFSGGNKLYDCSGWGANLTATNFRSAAQAGISRDNIDLNQLSFGMSAGFIQSNLDESTFYDNNPGFDPVVFGSIQKSPRFSIIFVGLHSKESVGLC